MTSAGNAAPGGAGYEDAPMDELEERTQRARESFRDAFGHLKERLGHERERVSARAEDVRSVWSRGDEWIARHYRAAALVCAGLGFALGYRRRRVVAEREPGEVEPEYVLVRREPARSSPLRAAAVKLAGMAASEALQAAGQALAERRQAGDAGAAPEPGDAEDTEAGEPKSIQFSAADPAARSAARAENK